MSAPVFAQRLRSGSSILALSAIALLGSRSALAQTAITDGLYGGGGTLASLALRQAFDCYAGIVVGTGFAAAIPGWDGNSYSTAFNSVVPTPSLLPTTCTSAPVSVEGLYAAVGSGNGLRGFISNRADQLFRHGVNTGTWAQLVGLPAVPPQFIDNNNVNATTFGEYPYPRIDFGVSDAPLPGTLASLTTFTYNVTPATNWVSAASITVTRANTTSTVAYSTASYGAPIQLPLFAAPVAIAVNLPTVVGQTPDTATTSAGGITWTINSQVSTTAPGGRVQLSTAQICAIFSGLVTDWSSTTTIPYLRNEGWIGTQAFSDDNTYHAASTVGTPGTGATPYASASAPIVIVYRSDGSGTSYIFTNYLKTVCPLLDPSNVYGYLSIFATSVLPNNSFTQLINKITAYGRTVNTVAASGGDDAAASAIGNASNAPTQIGRIGYLSNNFVTPYNGASTAPGSASLQNDYLRANGVYHPGQSIGGAPMDFIAPTPTSADAAWAALATYGVTPATTWGYNDYNIYTKNYAASIDLNQRYNPALPWSGVSISGRSILPLADGASAYPLVGTSYLLAYSCYGKGADGVAAFTRVVNLKAFLNWFYTNTQSQNIVANNGFHVLASNWVSNIQSEYLGPTNSASITAYNVLGKVRGCTGVTGGAQ